MIALDVAYGELDWSLREDPRVTVIERVNARALEPSQLPYAPDLIVVDVSFISLRKVLPAVLACAAERFDALAMVKPQFEAGREHVSRGGVVRDPEARQAAIDAVAACGSWARRCSASPPRLPGPAATERSLAGRGRRRADVETLRVDRAMRAVVKHPPPPQRRLGRRARRARRRRAARGATLVFDAEEVAQARLERGEGIELVETHDTDVDLCIVLGGDGTILTGLRDFAGTGVPVFAINFGEVGFLATLDPDGLGEDFDRAFAGDFERLELPTIEVGRPDGSWTAINDISVHRKPGMRVADLAYGLAGEEIGRVRCDGLVVATPQGSTGYNLANGGPILAWGVRGFVVSFIAPHSLTARALVVAPDDLLTINNASREEPVEVHVDGRPACELPAGEDIHVEFALSQATLAQLPGRELLPPPARALRQTRKISVTGQRIRPRRLVDRRAHAP